MRKLSTKAVAAIAAAVALGVSGLVIAPTVQAASVPIICANTVGGISVTEGDTVDLGLSSGCSFVSVSASGNLEPLSQTSFLAFASGSGSILALVEDGDTLLINSGSTTLRIFPNLVGIKNLKVITSNMGAFLETSETDMELILTGGIFREQSKSLVGSFALHNIQRVIGTKCFIGVDGISRKHGLTTPILQEAEIARMMIERTQGKVIVVADSSKLGVVSNFVSASIDQVDILVTTKGVNEEFIAQLEEEGIEIIIAPSSPDISFAEP